jgi:ABC-type antimicrobial peptide transport system permease subunit
MAIGARPSDVLRLVVGQGCRLALAGVALGLGAAMVVGRAMRGLLFGISSSDPVTYAVVTVALISIALLASYIPARRATRVDPMVALRGE